MAMNKSMRTNAINEPMQLPLTTLSQATTSSSATPNRPQPRGIVELYADRVGVKLTRRDPDIATRLYVHPPVCIDPLRSPERRLRRLGAARRSSIFVLALFLALASVTQAAYAHQRYVVQPGDTLAIVAEKFGIDAISIIREPENEGLPHLYEGEVLIIPDPGESREEAMNASHSAPLVSDVYIVQIGDSIETIALAYAVDPQAILDINGLAWGEYLYEGQRLLIPADREHVGISDEIDENAAVSDIPGANGEAISFVWVPALTQQRNLSCEYASVAIATAAYGEGIPEEAFYDVIPVTLNPHYGYRGNIDGLWGQYDDYGIYPEPLVPVLNEWGFAGEVAYTDGHTPFLTNHLDAGHPVVVWLALWGDTGIVYDDEGVYTVFAGAHVVTAYAYDEWGVYIVDPATGSYKHIDWGTFRWAWGTIDGMSLAIYPL